MITDQLDELPPIVIVRLRNMTAIDATGLRALEDLAASSSASGRTLILCGARDQPAALMHGGRFHEHVGARQRLSEHRSGAVARQRDPRPRTAHRLQRSPIRDYDRGLCHS